jgi:hypothetical protein
MRYSIGMGLYGFTRGIRSEPPQKGVPPILLTDRVVFGLVNGGVYYLPGWNVFHTLLLANRLEIRMRGRNPADYPIAYYEFLTRRCLDTV